jgi:7-cyano-7-deazaguanine synthase
MTEKAIVLLSGGVDSSTCAVLATREYKYDTIALSFDYNQRHKLELEAAQKVCKFLGVKEHFIVPINIGQFGGSALTDKNIVVPERDVKTMSKAEIPVTYVPMRNTVLLSIAFSLGEAKNARTIFFGANIVDYSGYPDCRPEYIEAIVHAANLGSKTFQEDKSKSFRVITPLIFLTKVEIVKLGLKYGFDYNLTYSCYNGVPGHCRKCDSCQFRFAAFKEAGIEY